MASEAQLRDIVERLARPILMTVTHKQSSTGASSSPPCCRQLDSDQRVLYSVAVLTHTEHRMVCLRLAELLANQGSRDFVFVLDLRRSACAGAQIAAPQYSESCCSSTEVDVEGAQLQITNSFDAVDGSNDGPRAGDWVLCPLLACCQCISLSCCRPFVLGITDDRFSPVALMEEVGVPLLNVDGNSSTAPNTETAQPVLSVDPTSTGTGKTISTAGTISSGTPTGNTLGSSSSPGPPSQGSHTDQIKSRLRASFAGSSSSTRGQPVDFGTLKARLREEGGGSGSGTLEKLPTSEGNLTRASISIKASTGDEKMNSSDMEPPNDGEGGAFMLAEPEGDIEAEVDLEDEPGQGVAVVVSNPLQAPENGVL